MDNPAAPPSLTGSQLRCTEPRFNLKFHQSNLHAECLSVPIRLCLAEEDQSSCQVPNICCRSQEKSPGEPEEPLGMSESVSSGVCCSGVRGWGGYVALWLPLLRLPRDRRCSAEA